MALPKVGVFVFHEGLLFLRSLQQSKLRRRRSKEEGEADEMRIIEDREEIVRT
jgi:hypothetical protein